MLHAAVILDRAKRRSGQLKPFARGPHGIAARRALAFEHPGFLLLRRGRLPIGVETGMGEGANGVQDRRDGRKKRLAGGGGAHRRSEEHTSELQSLMRISYAVFCLKKTRNMKSRLL